METFNLTPMFTNSATFNAQCISINYTLIYY